AIYSREQLYGEIIFNEDFDLKEIKKVRKEEFLRLRMEKNKNKKSNKFDIYMDLLKIHGNTVAPKEFSLEFKRAGYTCTQFENCIIVN
ncbi:MAG: hypothetical protein ACRC1D_06035, partial [Culicoidibacterales bacterium]